MRRAFGFVLALTFAVGCGGNSFQSGAGGAGGSAGSSSAGSSSAGTSTGKGGGPGSGGSVSTGGTGGIDCRAVDCAAPYCPDGQLVTPPGQCCPVCSCDLVSCPAIGCPNGETPIMEPGACCPSCPPTPPASCANVSCLPQEQECPQGYSWRRPTGACCAACMADGPIACNDIACPDQMCPYGYVPGDLTGSGCCYECVPDPLFCASDLDCVIADRPRPCCGCPEAISTRMLEEDLCWSALGQPRQIPQECYPQEVCGAVCSPCVLPTAAKCQQNRCTTVY